MRCWQDKSVSHGNYEFHDTHILVQTLTDKIKHRKEPGLSSSSLITIWSLAAEIRSNFCIEKEKKICYYSGERDETLQRAWVELHKHPDAIRICPVRGCASPTRFSCAQSCIAPQESLSHRSRRSKNALVLVLMGFLRQGPYFRYLNNTQQKFLLVMGRRGTDAFSLAGPVQWHVLGVVGASLHTPRASGKLLKATWGKACWEPHLQIKDDLAQNWNTARHCRAPQSGLAKGNLHMTDVKYKLTSYRH